MGILGITVPGIFYHHTHNYFNIVDITFYIELESSCNADPIFYDTISITLVTKYM